MKKLTLSLLCLFAIAATTLAQTQIIDLSNLSNNKAYWFRNYYADNGYDYFQTIYYSADYPDRLWCAYVLEVEDDINDPNQHFALLQHEGKTYLYSIAAKKFVKAYNDGLWLTDLPWSFVEIHSSQADGNTTHPWCFAMEGAKLFGPYPYEGYENSGYIYGGGTNHANPMYSWAIYEAGDFDSTEAMTALAAGVVTVAEQNAEAKGRLKSVIDQAHVLTDEKINDAAYADVINEINELSVLLESAETVYNSESSKKDDYEAAITPLTDYMQYIADILKPGDDAEVVVLLDSANVLLNLPREIGYPGEASRDTLQAVIDNLPNKNARWRAVMKSAIASFYDATDVILPKNGKKYTLTFVTRINNGFYMNHAERNETLTDSEGNDSIVKRDYIELVAVQEDTAYPETAVFTCRHNDDGTLSFIADNGMYVIYCDGTSSATGNAVYGMQSEDDEYSKIQLVRILPTYAALANRYEDFWGNCAWYSKRSDARGYSIIVARTDGSGFDGANIAFYNDTYTSALKIEEYPSESEYVLDDNSEYTNDTTEENANVTYTRTFDNTDWQALYVPFAMNYEDWSSDFDVAEINNVHQYDDDENGTIDRTELEIIHVKSGSITANTPYFIRAKETGEKTITVSATTLYAGEANSIDCASVKNRYTFTGTYSGVDGETMYDNGYYAVSNGALVQATSANAALGAFRWYLNIESRADDTSLPAQIRLRVIGENNDGTTAIEEVTTESHDEQIIYDLSGRRVQNPTKEVYIVNGKKVLLK